MNIFHSAAMSSYVFLDALVWIAGIIIAIINLNKNPLSYSLFLIACSIFLLNSIGIVFIRLAVYRLGPNATLFNDIISLIDAVVLSGAWILIILSVFLKNKNNKKS
jgi:hypothetical protein